MCVQDVFSGCSVQFSSVLSLSHVRLFATPWIATRQASLSITNSRSPPKPMSIKSVMPSSHLILCHPLLLLPPIPPSIRVFSSESTLRMRWPKYWSFSFIISGCYSSPNTVFHWCILHSGLSFLRKFFVLFFSSFPPESYSIFLPLGMLAL